MYSAKDQLKIYHGWAKTLTDFNVLQPRDRKASTGGGVHSTAASPQSKYWGCIIFILTYYFSKVSPRLTELLNSLGYLGANINPISPCCEAQSVSC